ncbi:hypothetical protein ACVWYG_001551 [Pedobacter sp. UYEF25]
MKFKILLFILTSLFLVSCSDGFEQSYDNYEHYNKEATLRNKTWFPDIINDDSYNLKNDSYLDPLCAYGVFNYSNTIYYDSIFTNSQNIDRTIFNEKVKTHSYRRPRWFVDPALVSKDSLETIQIKRFYIARDKEKKKIYFIISN